MNFKLYNPENFQGNLKKKNYFEGWYFKNVSANLSHVYSFIPGVSLTGKNPHAFIQIINGVNCKTEYITYPLEDFTWKHDGLYLQVGESVFTDSFIQLNIQNENIKVSGRIDFNGITGYPKKLFSPGIMGWYSFIPFMECKHGIVSVNHHLSGKISVNDEYIDFGGGKGYIEKDWGTSFPEAWIWMQANNFVDQETSFNFSVAKIPWLGKFFIGFIGFLYFNKKFYLYSTYNNSEMAELDHTEKSVQLILKNQNTTLKVTAVKSSSGELIAPVSGDMTRRIKESIDSAISVELFDKEGNLLYKDTSQRAGLEVIEKIFDYVKLKPASES